MKLLALVLGFISVAAHAADWPMHRGGPELRGIAQMAAPAKAELLWQFKGEIGRAHV